MQMLLTNVIIQAVAEKEKSDSFGVSIMNPQSLIIVPLHRVLNRISSLSFIFWVFRQNVLML